MRLRHLLMSTLAAVAVGAVAPGMAAEQQATTAAGTPGSGTVGDQGSLINIDTSDKPLETVLQWISRRANVNVVCNDREEAERPTRVTLRLANVTWQEAVKQLADKYGFVVEKQSDRIWNLSRPPRVRMDLQQAPLGTVLEALARQAGVNLVFTDIDANKPITVTLQGVPWKEAMDVIVKDAGYAWIQREYNIIQVVTPDKLQKDLSTQIFPIFYHKAPDLAKIVEAQLGEGGKALVDERSNAIICTGTPLGLQTAARVIKDLDLRTRQVLIEMRFVDFSESDAQKIGFDPINMGFDVANFGAISGLFSPFGGTPTTSLTATRGQSVPTSTGNFTAGISFELLTQLSSTELLQAPTLLVTDNQEGEIRIGREIRFAELTRSEATDANSSPTITIKEAQSSPVKDGITIKVTPHIGGDGFVTLELDAKNEDAILVPFNNGLQPGDDGFAEIRLPNKDQQELKTSLILGNGKLGVIGGLLRNKVVEQETKTPFISDIPLFGNLFRKQTSSIEKRNLTIFIRPYIISSDEKPELERRLEETKARLSNASPAKVPSAAAPAPVPKSE